MNSISYFFLVAAFPLLSGALTGCATPDTAGHESHQAPVIASGSPGTMQGPADARPMEMMDMKAMCEKHRQMMSAKSPEQQAMMDEHMKTMPPEMRSHMQMMREQCK